MIDKKLAYEINAMAAEDQAMRTRAEQDGKWDEELDKEHTRQLKAIIRKHGWPSIPLVGKKASFNAWLIAQHADHDLAFQKRVLGLLHDALDANHTSIQPSCIAFLTDRILVAENKKQLYGTQFYRNRAGQFVPRSIRDIVGIESRRAAYGLRAFIEDLAGAAERA